MKLTYSLINNENNSRQQQLNKSHASQKSSSSISSKMELISRFKCLVDDSFGKLVSREANIYRLRVDASDLLKSFNNNNNNNNDGKKIYL